MDDLLSEPGNHPHVFKVIRACVARTNARAFFGEELGTCRFKNQPIMLAELIVSTSLEQSIYGSRGGFRE